MSGNKTMLIAGSEIRHAQPQQGHGPCGSKIASSRFVRLCLISSIQNDQRTYRVMDTTTTKQSKRNPLVYALGGVLTIGLLYYLLGGHSSPQNTYSVTKVGLTSGTDTV
jgi:hypothetical protein